MNGPAFAAQLAGLARFHDPEDRRGTRILGAVVLACSQLKAADDPAFYLDGSSMVVSGRDVPLAPPIREALRPLDAALRAHGCGGVRISGFVDRNTVVALLKTARASTAPGPRSELQRAFERNGGSGLEFIPPLAAAHLAEAETWAAWAALGRGEDRVACLQALIERLEQSSDPLARALATLPGRPQLSGAGLAGRALLLGKHLGLGRGPLLDLALCAFALEDPPEPEYTGPSLSRLDRTQARILLVTRGTRAEGEKPHLYSRILALTRELDLAIREDGPRRLTPHAAVARLQSDGGRRYDPALVAALVAAVGEWPIGTAILLSSGEVGVVYSLAAHAGQVSRPVVRVVIDRSGNWVGNPEAVDLSLPAWERTQILASIDPDTIGLDLVRALAAAR